MVLECTSSEAAFFGPLTQSVHPTTCLIAPTNQLKPESASEDLGLVKDRETLCIYSSGHNYNFRESLLNSKAVENLFKNLDPAKAMFSFEI